MTYSAVFFTHNEKIETLAFWKKAILKGLYLCIVGVLIYRVIDPEKANLWQVNIAYITAIWLFAELKTKLLDMKVPMFLSRVIYAVLYVNVINLSFLRIEALFYISPIFIFIIILRIFNPIFNGVAKRGQRKREGKGVEVENVSKWKKILFGKTGSLRMGEVVKRGDSSGK